MNQFRLDLDASATLGTAMINHLDQILHGDSITGLSSLNNNSVHLILSDIPYGIGADDWDVLHENTNTAYLGSSPAQKQAGAIFKKRGKPINGWSEADREIPRQYYAWCVPDWVPAKWTKRDPPEWF